MTFVLLIAGVVILVGSIVQGTVGYGLNLIAGPILAILDPMLVPVPVLMVATFQAVVTVLRERGHVEWGNVGWAMVGRLPGNVLGVLALAMLPARGLNLAIALTVLVCVVLSVVTWTPRPTRPSLVLAGAASGTFGTTSSIGGPPIALLYQNGKGPAVRATLGAYFLLASVSSLVTLGFAGHIRGEHFTASAVLLPFMAVGFLLSGPLRKHLGGGRLRVAVLSIATVSAVALALKAVL